MACVNIVGTVTGWLYGIFRRSVLLDVGVDFLAI